MQKKKKTLTENNMKVVVMIKSNIIKTNKTDRNSGIKSKGRLLKKTSVKQTICLIRKKEDMNKP